MMRGGLRLHSPDLYMTGEVGFPFRQLERIYSQLVEEDEGLMFEAESMDVMDAAYNPGDVISAGMILDAVTARYNKFPRTMAALQRVFNRQLSGDLGADAPEIGEPRKAGGFATVTAQFPFNDGQRVTIVFHAPGSGSTIRGSDEVVAFRWLLNKRDITHIVAPEMTQGIMRDIPLQQLARRISQLVEKNSPRFRAKQEKINNARTALRETELVVEQLSQQVDALQLELLHMGEDSPEKAERIAQLQTELESWNKRNAALSGALPRSSKTRTIRAHDMELETTMEVVSVDELITSDDERFDQRLQPRDRTREASREQIRNMVRTLDPYQLMDAPTADTGAPVVGPDGLVESGNGRTMALRQVVKDPLLHRRYAQAVEEQTGIKIREGEVLIRRRTTPMNLEQRMEFTKAANQQNIAKMSSTEQGLSDARMIDDGMLSEFKGGDLTSVANTSFVSAFIGKLPVNERNDLIGAHGHLSQTGVIRIRNALLGSAYESADIMTRVTESTDDNVKSISNALVDAAPAIARLKRDVEAGRVEPEFDISKQIAEAAGKVSQARANRQAIGEVLNQNDMFGERDLITEELIKAFYNHDMTRALGRDKIALSLIHYATQARNETTDGNLFGASITPAQLLADANKRRDEWSTSQGSIFDSLSRVFMHPVFDGMVIKDEGPAMPLTGLELDAAMVSLYARDGYALMTEAHSLQIMDAAYNPGEEVDSMVLDAVSGDASKLPRVIGVLARSMGKKLTGGLSVEGHTVGKPKVSGGFATVTAQLQLNDGQTVSVIFHAPDNDPKRIAPSDQVIAFRFLMNSRDITHVVAPEMVKQGIMRDIPLATVTTRISQLVQKNSDKFTKQQEKNSTLKADLAKAEADVQALTERSVILSDEVAELEQVAPLELELGRIEAENEGLRKQIAERKDRQKPAVGRYVGRGEIRVDVPPTPAGYSNGVIKISTTPYDIEFSHIEKTGRGDGVIGQWRWPIDDYFSGRRITIDDLRAGMDDVSVIERPNLWVGLYNKAIDEARAKFGTGEPAVDEDTLESIVSGWLQEKGVKVPDIKKVTQRMLPVMFDDLAAHGPDFINQLESYFIKNGINAQYPAMDARNGYSASESDHENLQQEIEKLTPKAIEDPEIKPEPEIKPQPSNTTYFVPMRQGEDGEYFAYGRNTGGMFSDEISYGYKQKSAAQRFINTTTALQETGRIFAVTGFEFVNFNYDSAQDELRNAANKLVKGEAAEIYGTPVTGRFVDSVEIKEKSLSEKLPSIVNLWRGWAETFGTGEPLHVDPADMVKQFDNAEAKLRKALSSVSMVNLKNLVREEPKIPDRQSRANQKVIMVEHVIGEFRAAIAARVGEQVQPEGSSPEITEIEAINVDDLKEKLRTLEDWIDAAKDPFVGSNDADTGDWEKRADEIRAQLSAAGVDLNTKPSGEQGKRENEEAFNHPDPLVMEVYNLEKEWKGAFRNAKRDGGFKRRLRALAKRIPEDNEAAVAMAERFATQILHDDWDNPLKSDKPLKFGESKNVEKRFPAIAEATETLRKAAAGEFKNFAATMDAAEKAILSLESFGVADEYEELISQVTDRAFAMDTAENGA